MWEAGESTIGNRGTIKVAENTQGVGAGEMVR